MKKLLFILASALLIGNAVHAQGQDKATLEKERQQLAAELKKAQSDYEKVRGKSKATLGELHAINVKTQVQERYVGTINKDIRRLTNEIYLNAMEIRKLQMELDTLKMQYSRSVVYAYKNRASYNYLNFLFSASGFNDALRRVQYLKSYRSYRQQQVDRIVRTQAEIAEQKKNLQGKQSDKKDALAEQQDQLNDLNKQRKEKDAVVAKLKSQEKDLSKQIAAKKKRDAALRNQITAMVRREIEEARRKAEADARAAEARNNASNTNTGSVTSKPATTTRKTSVLNSTAADVKLSSDFEKNRGRLPWPVDNGSLLIPYGVYTVPGTTVKGDNPGLTISTDIGQSVKAVFDGDVTTVSNVGDAYVVMVRHGKYFTVYSNLASVSVSRGTRVSTGQVVGKAGRAYEAEGGSIDFILMNEGNKVNPQSWLHR